ncbi:MAG: RNA polymerase factor sigma-54 [Bacillota bacterium]
MGTGPNVRLEHTQKLVFRNELQQAVAILQFSSQELEGFISEQLVENPLLEMREEESCGDSFGNEAKGTEEERESTDWIDYFSDSSDLGLARDDGSASRGVDPERSSGVLTLYDFLITQVGLLRLSNYDQLICEYIIGNIDGDGYFRINTREAAGYLGVPQAAVEKALKLVQTLDPPGVGARNLKECLLLQAESAGLSEGLVGAIVSGHLEAVAAGKLAGIARQLGVATEEVSQAVGFIRCLNPKPGSSFPGEPVQYLLPDVIIEKVGGEYVVLINENAYPRLVINRTYRELARRDTPNPEAKDFIQAKYKQALWIIKSIEQRRTTVYRIVTELVKRQRGFLDVGIAALKPLTLREVAQAVELHESTVSRAVSRKYVQCPRGIFKLKVFFSGGLSDASGQAVAAQSIKWLIKEIVASENPEKPLSDQEIANILAARGLKVSRRTVAKYRADQGISGTAKRRIRTGDSKKKV